MPFFGSPSQLDVRTGGSQQNRTAHFAFSGIHKFPRGIRQISIFFSQVFRERDAPTRAGIYWRGASYSVGLAGGQEFTIWNGSVDAGWGGSVGEHDK